MRVCVWMSACICVVWALKSRSFLNRHQQLKHQWQEYDTVDTPAVLSQPHTPTQARLPHINRHTHLNTIHLTPQSLDESVFAHGFPQKLFCVLSCIKKHKSNFYSEDINSLLERLTNAGTPWSNSYTPTNTLSLAIRKFLQIILFW